MDTKEPKPGGRLNGIINSLAKFSSKAKDEVATLTEASKNTGVCGETKDEATNNETAPKVVLNVDAKTDALPTDTSTDADLVVDSAVSDDSQSSVCSECNSVIRNAANLAVHMRRHLGYKPYNCSKCPYTGYDQDDVHRHASRSHTTGAPAHVRFKPDTDMETSVSAMITRCKKFNTPPTAAANGTSVAVKDTNLTSTVVVTPPATSKAAVAAPTPPPPYRAAQMLIQTLLRQKTTELMRNNGAGEIRCDLCSTSVKVDISSLITHLKCHLNFAGYTCGMCEVSCPSWTMLTEHISNFHRSTVASSGRRLFADSLLTLAECAFVRAPPKIPCGLCGSGVIFRKLNIFAHAAEHESNGSFKCAMCAQRFVDVLTVKQHISTKHPGSFVLFSYTPKVFSQTVDAFETQDRAFPFLKPEILESSCQNIKNGPTESSSSTDRDSSLTGLRALTTTNDAPTKATIECLLCSGQISRNMSCLIAHAKVHLAYKPLKCEYCSFRHFAMSKIKRHNVRVHPGKPVKVSYHPISDIGRQVKDMKLKCFGKHASSTGWPTADASAASNDHEMMMEEKEDLDVYEDDDDSLLLSPPDGSGQGVVDSLLPMSLPSDVVGNKAPMAALLEQLMRNTHRMSNGGGNVTMVDSDDDVADDLGAMSGRSSSAACDINGVAKKICNLCSTFIANNANSFENHACKHLDYKPFHCHYCAYQSYIRGKVTRHIQQVHQGFQIKISHKPLSGMKDRVLAMKFECFPFLLNNDCDGGEFDPNTTASVDRSASKLSNYSSSVGDGSDFDTRCRLCDVAVANSDAAMDEHIQAHISKKQFHCPVCSYETSLLIRAKQHAHSAHPTSLQTRILCCPPSGLKGLHELRINCFGAAAWEGVDSQKRLLALIASNTKSKSSPQKGKSLEQMTAGAMSMNDAVQEMIKLQQQLLVLQQQQQQSSSSGRPKKSNAIGVDDDETPLPVLFSTNSAAEESSTDATAGGGGGYPDYPSAFPYYKPGSGGTKPPNLNCTLCKAVVTNDSNAITIHVKKHVKEYMPYQCNYCVWKANSESAVKHHQAQSHKGQPAKVLYNSEQEEMARVQEACFPQTRLSALLNGSLMRSVGNSGGGAGTNGGRNASTPSGANTTANNTSNGSGGSTLLKKLICQICKNTIADNPKSIGIHVKNHLNYKPYRCPFCKYMSCEQSKARRHVEHVHSQSGELVEIHAQEGIKEKIVDMKAQCFPSLMNRTEPTDTPDDPSASNSNLMPLSMVASGGTTSPPTTLVIEEKVPSLSEYAKGFLPELTPAKETNAKFGSSDRLAFMDDALMISERESSIPPPIGGTEGKLECRVCKNWVSVNPNSLEVHTKTHLNFKQHQCGYCSYRSCIAGKVKRHIDNVHNGEQKKVYSFTSLTAGLRKVINDMRATCFPQLEGSSPSRSISEVKIQSEILKQQLIDELQSMEVLQLPSSEQEAARSAYQAAVNATETLGVVDSGGLLSGFDSSSNLTALDSSTPAMGNGPPSPSDSVAALDSLLGVGDDDDDIGDGVDDDLDDEDDALLMNVGRQDSADAVKLVCQQCMSTVADNPSSLGLHVRNHLDYKPFSCNLCDYKSCIQAKVKRHLRNVHKCPTDEMTYSPEPDIRMKVMDMKLRCFPKMAEAVASALSCGIDNNANNIDLAFNYGASTLFGAESSKRTLESGSQEGLSSLSTKRSRLDTILGAKMMAGFLNSAGVTNSANATDRSSPLPVSSAVDPSASPLSMSNAAVVECQICATKVPNDELSRTRHLTNHMSESQWQCSDCEFNSFVQNFVKRHIEEVHDASGGSSAQPIRLGGNRTTMTTSEYQKLSIECFKGGEVADDAADVTGGSLFDGGDDGVDADDDDDLPICTTYKFRKTKNTFDGPRYICKICGQAVSMYASSLYVHVKNHMNYKPYCCAHCDYRSPVKSKVRRHIQNAHRELPMTINYFPTPGIEHEVLKMKKKCFPDVTSFATLTNDKVPCQVCKTDVSDTPLSKSVHAKNHLDAKPYHCGYCPYRSCLKGETRRHVTRQHAGKPAQIHFVDAEVAEKEHVDTMVMRCFPNTDAASLNAIAPERPPTALSVASSTSSRLITTPTADSAATKNKTSPTSSGGSLPKGGGESDVEEPGESPLPSVSGRKTRSALAAAGGLPDRGIKLGQAFREWYCPYCPFSNTSKYHVKEHVVGNHPGHEVHVSGTRKNT